MATYTVPQVLINQLISEVSLNTVANQNVLVIGPSYELYRYSDPATRARTYLGEYASDSGVTPDDVNAVMDSTPAGTFRYPGSVGLRPDSKYTKVFFDNAVLQLADVTEHVAANSVEDQDDCDVKFDFALSGSSKGVVINSDDVTAKAAGNTTLFRDIVAGDVIIFKDDDGKVISWSRIIATKASTEGGDPDIAVLADEVPDKYDHVFIGAMLHDVVVKSKQNIRGRYNWEAYDDADNDKHGITIKNAIRVEYKNWDPNKFEYDVVSASVYVEHRDLDPTKTTIESIAHPTKVEQELGTVHPDNPLAFGVYMAALNSGDRLVYYRGVTTDDLAGYQGAIDSATLTNQVYLICPTTTDGAVITALQAHVKEMSSARNKLWRIAFVSQEVPDKVLKIGGTRELEARADLIHAPGDSNDEYSRLKFEKNQNLVETVRPGDVVHVYTENEIDDWDDTPRYVRRTVAKVLSNTVLAFTSPIGTGEDGIGNNDSDKNYVVEVYRPLKGTEKAKYVADMSSKMASRRMYNVFPDYAITGGVEYSGAFTACAVAGLVSSVLPQQPVTNVELNGIDDVPATYSGYSKDNLDTMAAGGTFIVMQDRPGSKVYVRHQISTEYTSANLMKAELSVTKNLDSISYYFAEIFAPLIGKYNITPELIEVIRSKLETGLSALEAGTGAGLYGPQVLVEGTDIAELRQSDVNKDHIYARLVLNLPVPFNYFDLDLVI